MIRLSRTTSLCGTVGARVSEGGRMNSLRFDMEGPEDRSWVLFGYLVFGCAGIALGWVLRASAFGSWLVRVLV